MDNQNLQKRIEALEKWKDERTRQQITFPLDTQSNTILNKYFSSVIGSIFNLSVSGQEFRKLLLQQDSKVYVISAMSQFISFSVNTATDIITLGADLTSGAQGVLQDDQFVTVNVPTPGVPAAPLDNGFGYFVVNSTGTTIQLSDVIGGAPIDLTTVGTGVQYLSVE